MKNDIERKQFLAKCLPEKLEIDDDNHGLFWIYDPFMAVQDTELLDLCWQVEEKLTETQVHKYDDLLYNVPDKGVLDKQTPWADACTWHCTWQQKLDALYEVLKEEV